METLGEYLSGKSGLFAAISDVEIFPFIEGDEENLDLILKINYGQRTLFTPYKDLSINELAGVIVSQYKEKWQNYVKLYALQENVNDRRELTETIDTLEDRTNAREDINKVSAFNSPDFVNNDGSNSDSTDSLDGLKTRTLTDENISPQASYALLSNLARGSILQDVMSDISKTLTLSIY